LKGDNQVNSPVADDSPSEAMRYEHLLVRISIILLMAFTLLNVMRQLTFFIGDIQYYGKPQPKDIGALVQSLGSFFLGGMAAKLRTGSLKAWWSTIFTSCILGRHVWWDLLYLQSLKARGDSNGDVQIVFLIFALTFLVLANLLLLLPPSIQHFFGKAKKAKALTITDIPERPVTAFAELDQ
jgi:hypothetical protein